jgi:hypothetical protein
MFGIFYQISHNYLVLVEDGQKKKTRFLWKPNVALVFIMDGDAINCEVPAQTEENLTIKT